MAYTQPQAQRRQLGRQQRDDDLARIDLQRLRFPT